MRTTIIAVGNGGYNLATDIINTNIFSDTKFIICDTDEKSLEEHSASADATFCLDKFRGKVKVSMMNFADDIIKSSTERVIICATFGGFTGSKYAPLIALNAILKGKFVCSFFTLDFSFEGEKHEQRALNARMQSIVASNFVIQQNNDRLKEIETLGLGEMNKPIVDTVINALRNHTLEELSLWVGPESIQDLIPVEYRLHDIPLLWLRSDCYRGIEESERINVFNLYS
ncbi:hypothetical protein EEL50_12340 [Muribaculaceae bacterium Isolate-105 (HZI)]|nr:hypothetical protein EEL50_12340 [Muribaculaceae bacterium Isolate-105 (HZI)]